MRGRRIGGDIAQIAVYSGDTLEAMGTIRSCSKQLGIKATTLYYYLMPAYARRLAKRKHTARKVRRVVLLDD